jgi:cysteinyl-tRNA synthetase
LGLGLRQLTTLYLQKTMQGDERANHDVKAQELLQVRQNAKLTKDYTTADEVRTQLLTMGYEVIDAPDGEARLKVIG